MNNISFVGTSNFRAYFYLKAIKDAKINLNRVIIYNYNELNISKILNKKIEYKGFTISIDESFESLLKYFNAQIIEKESINLLTQELKENKEQIFIFCGKGGEIVSENILKLGKFLHIHPGKLPEYRGSTTIYYSLLEESRCYATAFFLDSKIDTGEIIKEIEFDILNIDFDYIYDPFIRTYLLIKILLSHNIYTKKQNNSNVKEYYIIHPVLKKLALLKKEKVVK